MTSQRLLGFLLIAVEAAMLGTLSHTVVFPVGIALLALYGAFTHRRYAWGKNQRLVVFLTLVVLFGAKYRLMPHQLRLDSLFVITLETLAVGQFLMVLQVGQFFLKRPDGRLPLWLPGLGAVALIFVSNVRVAPAERLIAQLLTLAYVCAAAMYFGASRPAVPGVGRRGGRQRAVASLIVLAVAAGLSWGSASALFHFERRIEELIVSFLVSGGRRHATAGFSRNARLGSLAEQKSWFPDLVVMQVYSTEQPGYLRGAAFDSFDGGIWTGPPDRQKLGPVIWPPYSLAQFEDQGNFFLLQGAVSPAWHRLEIWPDPSLEGTLFNRLETAFIQAPVREIRSDAYRITETDELMPGYPFVTYAALREDRPRDELRETGYTRPLIEWYLKPRSHVRALARRVFAGCRTTQEKIDAVQSYFHKNYSYQLGTRKPERVEDAVEWFLLTRPAAHCEYFAAGTVCLLRQVDVPCRYVTGFVVTEKNRVGNYWVARNRDAHAWVEAFDEDRGWVIVESTPAGGVPQSAAASLPFQLWEALRTWLQMFRVRLDQGGLEWLGAQLLRFLAGPLGIALVLAAAGARIFWMLRRRYRRADAKAADPIIRQLHGLLGRMDRQLERLHLQRRPGETLHQFAERIADASGVDGAVLQAAADWYRAYAFCRYRGRVDEHTVQQLAQALPRN